MSRIRALQRRVEIAVRARLDLRVAALLDQRRQPADLQLAADDDQQVGLLQLEDEARLGFDEVRILIAARDRLDGDAVAADLARNRREILGGRDDVQLALRARRRATPATQRQTTSSDLTFIMTSVLVHVDSSARARTDARRARRSRTGTGTGTRWRSARRRSCVRRYWPRTWLNSLGQ